MKNNILANLKIYNQVCIEVKRKSLKANCMSTLKKGCEPAGSQFLASAVQECRPGLI
jgi:hypothetical protein